MGTAGGLAARAGNHAFHDLALHGVGATCGYPRVGSCICHEVYDCMSVGSSRLCILDYRSFTEPEQLEPTYSIEQVTA